MLDLFREYWWVVCGAIGELICIAAGVCDYLLDLDRANPTPTPKPSSFLSVCAFSCFVLILGPIGLGSVQNPIGFYNAVKDYGKFDLKNTPTYDSSRYTNGFIYGDPFSKQDIKIKSDAPGNMMFGYVGDAAWWSTDGILHAGAGWANSRGIESRGGHGSKFLECLLSW